MVQKGVGVVVVSYNTLDQLRRCLRNLGDQDRIVVVDNASSDGSPEMVAAEFPRVHLIRSAVNLGFGKANNLGAQMVDRPLTLFLNSDAYAQTGAIDRLAETFSDPTVVAAGGRLLNPDGSLQFSTANRLTLWTVLCEQLYLEKLFPNSRFFSPYWNTLRLVQLPEPAETAQLMGAALMVRSGLEQFDERYFLYCEDTDLCSRLARRGRLVYVKSAEFVHELGASSASDPVRGVRRYNRGKELYFRLNHGLPASILCALLDRLGAILRALYWTARSLARPSQQARHLRNGFLALVLGSSRSADP